ncbi:MAG: InlB B-repeat-containing protein [Lachnospiraceae bacterium]|nr:InlB B-repeat-containing protein [Lachnospiraceae bacterium]
MPTATCTEDKVCSTCGIVLEKATGHKWNISAATCTEDKKCSRCGKVEKATGHTWDRVTASCTEDRKCVNCGTVDQKAFGHHSDMPTATCTEDKVCSTCGLILEKATGHNWNRSTPGCTEDRMCSRCGKTEKAIGHVWSSFSCTEDQKCINCGTIGQKALGHHAKNPSASCREDNICTTCGIVLEKKLDHKWDKAEATCTEAQKCINCGTTGEKAKGHDFSVLLRDVAPTCGEAGVKEYKCSRCSETRGENTAPNQKHSWEVKETVKETKESDGYILQYCPVCGLTQKTVLPKVGELKVNSSRLSFSENADSRDISLLNISNAGSVVVSVDPNAVGWVRVTRTGATTYKVEVPKNTEGSDRKGVITFKDPEYNRSVSVEVSQSSRGGCKILFDPNGGIGWSEPVIRTAVLGDVMGGTYPEPPRAPGYKTFDGWYSQKVGGAKWTEFTPVPSTQGVTLYAHWTDTKYFIAYDGNNYETGEMDKTPAFCNQDVTLAKNKFVKTGYVLAGWNTRRDGKGVEYSEGATVRNLVPADAENGTVITLYAHWVEIAKVTVSFNVNGGSDPSNRLAKETRTVVYKEPYGDLPELPSGVTAPEGKVFAGWETKDHVRVTAQSDVEDAADHVLYAVWRDNTYKIIFDGNGSLFGVMKEMTCTYGEGVHLPKCAFDDGDGFDVWSTTRTGTGLYAMNFKEDIYTEYPLIQDTSVESITLYAIWKEHHYSVEYIDPFHGKTIHKDEKWNNKHIYYVEACAPKIEGLRFLGYTTDYKLKGLMPEGADRSKLYHPGEAVVFDDPSILESSNIQLFCVYEVTQKDYIPVIYHDNGGDIPSRVEYIHWNTSTYQVPSVYYYDSEEHEAERPHKKGYVFQGWGLTSDAERSEAVSSVPIARGTTVVHLFAIWSPNGAKVTLDYGYGDKRRESLNPLGTGTFMLPNAKRDDYIFLGWQSDYDGEIYQAEEEISDLPKDLVLTALWDQRTYQIEFIDSYSNKVLKSGRYLSTESLAFEPEEIPLKGKTFDGWVYGSRVYTKNASVSDFVDMKSHVLAETILKQDEKVYRLYSHYKGEQEAGKVMVYYHLNSSTATGGPKGPTTAESKVGDISIVTSAEKPTDPHRVFLGWTTSINGRKYTTAGETYVIHGDPSGRVAPPTEYTFYACWQSKYKLSLDKNGCPDAKVDSIELEDVVPGQVIQMKKYKKSFGEPDGYTLLGWGTTPDTVTIGVDGEFTVPEREVTLYAIWSSKEYDFTFYDGFGREIARRTLKYDTTVTLSELDLPIVQTELSGYRFAGWTKEAGDTSKYYDINEKIKVTKNLTFYADYELVPGVPGKVVIHYLANGGKDVPAPETMDPGECYISSKVPTREGYYFRGWSRHNIQDIGLKLDPLYPDYPVDGDHKIEGKSGQRIVLYAVWERIDEISVNDLKEALEGVYGVGAFGDDKLLKTYTSSDWEKLNDTTYYVIRTDRKSKVKNYESTIMVIQYRNGTWNLDAYGAIEGIWSAIRFDILTSLPNTSARALDITFDVVNTAVELGISFYCPAGGRFVAGLHYANTAWVLIRKNEYKELFDAVMEETWNIATGYMKGKAESEVLFPALEELLGSEKLSAEKLGQYKELTLALLRETDEQIGKETEELDPYGSFDYAFGIFKERVAGQGFDRTIVDHTYQPIQKIYEYVFSNISGF